MDADFDHLFSAGASRVMLRTSEVRKFFHRKKMCCMSGALLYWTVLPLAKSWHCPFRDASVDPSRHAAKSARAGKLASFATHHFASVVLSAAKTRRKMRCWRLRKIPIWGTGLLAMGSACISTKTETNTLAVLQCAGIKAIRKATLRQENESGRSSDGPGQEAEKKTAEVLSL